MKTLDAVVKGMEKAVDEHEEEHGEKLDNWRIKAEAEAKAFQELQGAIHKRKEAQADYKMTDDVQTSLESSYFWAYDTVEVKQHGAAKEEEHKKEIAKREAELAAKRAKEEQQAALDAREREILDELFELRGGRV